MIGGNQKFKVLPILEKEANKIQQLNTMTYSTNIEKMENKEPQRIQKLSPSLIPTVTQSFKTLQLMIYRAIKVVHEEQIVLKLIRCEAQIEALIKDKELYDRTRRIEYVHLSGKELHSYFLQDYQRMNGTIVDNQEWNHCVSQIAEYIAQGKPMILYGKTGVGKTSIMQCFGRVLSILQNPNHQQFITKRAPELVDEFKKGHDINDMYSKPINTGLFKNAGLFIDDIGTEKGGISYGDKSDVIGDLILAIDANHQMNDMVSYSTNLSKADLKERYGDRAFSRLFKNRSVVVFPESIPDFRLNKV